LGSTNDAGYPSRRKRVREQVPELGDGPLTVPFDDLDEVLSESRITARELICEHGENVLELVREKTKRR